MQRRIRRHRGVAIAVATVIVALGVVEGAHAVEKHRLGRPAEEDEGVRKDREAELARMLTAAERQADRRRQAQLAFDNAAYHTGLVRLDDYDSAIALDPEFADAYYERARHLLKELPK